jgi:hypothetical protein
MTVVVVVEDEVGGKTGRFVNVAAAEGNLQNVAFWIVGNLHGGSGPLGVQRIG